MKNKLAVKGGSMMDLEQGDYSLQEEPGGCQVATLKFNDWHASYKNSIQSVNELSKLITLQDAPSLRQVAKIYHMRITHYYLSLIKNPQDPQDPIAKQCIPSLGELNDSAGSNIDPLSEVRTSPTPYLVHRYPDRVLLIVTGRCFMYCRHCTRKRLWPAKTSEPSLKDIDTALNYVRNDKNIREIIVSGGDPLTLPTERLEHILTSISRISNIEAVRIGTRAPVVLPQRIDEQLCRTLEKFNNLWVNVQFNHPNEITPQSSRACMMLARCGIPVSNQSVLLRGINDNPDVMTELCHKLQSIRVRPYYLFQCDPVVGASHFRTSVLKGIDIIERMRGHTSGMCIPTFVVDAVEGKGKIPLGPNYLLSRAPNGVVLRNYNNETVFYSHPVE